MIGTEEAVQEAQKELEELIKSLVRLQMTFEHRRMRGGQGEVFIQMHDLLKYSWVTGQRCRG